MKRHPLAKHDYGMIPDQRDQRDYMFAARASAALPTVVDWRPICPPVYDQGQYGSCTANGIGGAMEVDQIRQKEKNETPSRFFIYRLEREMEGTINQDAGASIRDGVTAVYKTGAPPESLWPYIPANFKKKPSAAAYKAVKKTTKYERVNRSLLDFKAALAAGNTPIIGFSVYQSFESDEVAKTGIMPMPQRSEQMLGGHCVLVVGYDDSKMSFLCRNSWGSEWALQGYFYMPYAYITSPSLSSDFWVIDSVQ